MLQRTSLYSEHLLAGAQCVNFAGWDMPLHYGSQIEEHHQVRQKVGIFDVSHMCVIDLQGVGATDFLRYICANDVARLKQPGRALYTCMLNPTGGIIDDCIVYRLSAQAYRVVVNAGTRDKDYAWLQQQAHGYDVGMTQRLDLCIIAVQGPKTPEIISSVWDADISPQLLGLRPFQFVEHKDQLMAQTGYTGEYGLEIILPADEAPVFWRDCIKHGAGPCGLAARDTLRLEAGLNLYGVDMNESTTPLNSNLAWTVSWTDAARDFIGKQALQEQLSIGIPNQLVGLAMHKPGVLRCHQSIYTEDASSSIGAVTSGGFSPTLGHAIALARIPSQIQHHLYIDRRGKRVPVSRVPLPFLKLKRPS